MGSRLSTNEKVAIGFVDPGRAAKRVHTEMKSDGESVVCFCLVNSITPSHDAYKNAARWFLRVLDRLSSRVRYIEAGRGALIHAQQRPGGDGTARALILLRSGTIAPRGHEKTAINRFLTALGAVKGGGCPRSAIDAAMSDFGADPETHSLEDDLVKAFKSFYRNEAVRLRKGDRRGTPLGKSEVVRNLLNAASVSVSDCCDDSESDVPVMHVSSLPSRCLNNTEK